MQISSRVIPNSSKTKFNPSKTKSTEVFSLKEFLYFRWCFLMRFFTVKLFCLNLLGGFSTLTIYLMMVKIGVINEFLPFDFLFYSYLFCISGVFLTSFLFLFVKNSMIIIISISLFLYFFTILFQYVTSRSIFSRYLFVDIFFFPFELIHVTKLNRKWVFHLSLTIGLLCLFTFTYYELTPRDLPMDDNVLKLFNNVLLFLLCMKIMAFVVNMKIKFRKENVEIFRENYIIDWKNDRMSILLAKVTHDLRCPQSVYEEKLEKLKQFIPTKTFRILKDGMKQFYTQTYDIVKYFQITNGKDIVFCSTGDFQNFTINVMAENCEKYEFTFGEMFPRLIETDYSKYEKIISTVCNKFKFPKFDFSFVKSDAVECVVKTNDHYSEKEIEAMINPLSHLYSIKSQDSSSVELGVLISKKFCEELGGDLKIEGSEFGTKVLFNFKCKISKGEKYGVSLGKKVGIKVFVAEDQVVMRKVYVKFLTGLKSVKIKEEDISFAEKGSDAVDVLSTKVFDYILLDFYLVGMTAEEVLRKTIEKLGDGKLNGKIVICTGDASVGGEELKKMGVKEVLRKPIKKSSFERIFGVY